MKWRRQLLLVAVASAAAICLYSHWHDPVLVGWYANVFDHHTSQLLNPFRSRAAEDSAAAFFKLLDGPECESGLKSMGDTAERVESTCTQEAKYPIVGWTIEAYGHDRDRLLLRFHVHRHGRNGESSSPFWVWLSNDGGNWKVTGYETWY